VPRPPTAPVVAGSLVAGYVVARGSGVRPLGGLVLLAGGGWCARRWLADRGPGTAALLALAFTGAFAASHPLARHVGAWPAVLLAAGAAGAAAWGLADRPAGRRAG
jgi:hypothetical protein